MDETVPVARPAQDETAIRAAFALADSRLLFGQVGSIRFADHLASSLRDTAWTSGPRAAYLGAGNGDLHAYYEIFEAFAEAVGCKHLHHVRAADSGSLDESRRHLAEADLVVLGGGDAVVAWRAFEQADLVVPLRQSFVAGAVHLGVSAGATLLGQGALSQNDRGDEAGPDGEWVPLLGLIPLSIATGGAEGEDLLKRLVQRGTVGRGLAIPSGAGAAYHPDGSVEPLGAALVEVHRASEGPVRSSHLLPLDEPSSTRDSGVVSRGVP